MSKSASHAGWQVIAVDAFADSDTQKYAHESVCIPLENGHFSEHLLGACLTELHQKYPMAHVLLGAGAEYFGSHIERLRSWKLCAQSQAVDQILNPKVFFAGLDELHIKYPETQFEYRPQSGVWLTKLFHSCGGMGVMRGSYPHTQMERCYWQQQQFGLPISALFIAQTNACERLGINLQFVNDGLSKQHPFIFSGLQANYQVSDKILLKIDGYANKLSKHFNYLGVFSLDMILTSEELFVLEMNPRISASFEMYERLNPQLNLVDAHIRVCELEPLPKLGPLSMQSKAYRIVFARQNILIPEYVTWPEWVVDRPHAGRLIELNEPVCSIHTEDGRFTPDEILRQLQKREQEVLSLLQAQNA